MNINDTLICNENIYNLFGNILFEKDKVYKVLNIRDEFITLNHILYANEYAEFNETYILSKFTLINELTRSIFICQCHSLEHQYSFYFSKEDGIYCEPHLNTYLPFYKRIILAIKYIFGYKSRFGAWDEFHFKKEDLNKLNNYIEIGSVYYERK